MTTPPETPRPKAVLFCPDCGHESGLDGDWLVHESPDSTEYQCPDCGAVIRDAGSNRPRVCAD